MKTVKEQMKTLCETAGFEQTEEFDKIVVQKERMGIGLRCPCDPNNQEKYCISYMCSLEIIRDGHCKCNCYRLKKKV